MLMTVLMLVSKSTSKQFFNSGPVDDLSEMVSRYLEQELRRSCVWVNIPISCQRGAMYLDGLTCQWKAKWKGLIAHNNTKDEISNSQNQEPDNKIFRPSI